MPFGAVLGALQFFQVSYLWIGGALVRNHVQGFPAEKKDIFRSFDSFMR